jgi:hypothetical protein
LAEGGSSRYDLRAKWRQNYCSATNNSAMSLLKDQDIESKAEN